MVTKTPSMRQSVLKLAANMKLLFALLTVVACTCVLAAKLPSQFKTCNAKDPQVDECLKNSIQGSFQLLKNGIRELGVAPLEPITIPTVVIAEGTEAVRVVQKFKNFEIHGLSTVTVDEIKSNLDVKNFSIELSCHADMIRYVADYEIDGRILLLPIKGHGKANIHFKNIHQRVKCRGEERIVDGKSYVEVTNTTLDTFKLDGASMHFDNLFDGNKELGDRINNVLNTNWKDVYEEMRRGYEEVLEVVYQDFLNKFLLKIPYNDLFLN